jgi:hypothetical protein
MCFKSNIWSFFGYDIGGFIGETTRSLKVQILMEKTRAISDPDHVLLRIVEIIF